MDPNRCFVQYMNFSQKNMHEHVYTDTHISAACFFPLNARFQAFRALKGNIYMQPKRKTSLHTCMRAWRHTYVRTHTYKGRYIHTYIHTSQWGTPKYCSNWTELKTCGINVAPCIDRSIDPYIYIHRYLPIYLHTYVPKQSLLGVWSENPSEPSKVIGLYIVPPCSHLQNSPGKLIITNTTMEIPIFYS